MALFWYDKTIGPLTITSSQELSLTLGIKTLVYVKSAVSTSFHFFGIAQVGGNIDGAVVSIVNISNISQSFTFDHESASASTAVNRFWNANMNNTNPGNGIGAAHYRYDAVVSRWIMFAHT